MIDDKEYSFHQVDIEILEIGIKDLFVHFNKKTLRELLLHRRYENLKQTCETKYAPYLDLFVGDVLHNLKKNGDVFYKHFLNNFGDLIYSRFNVKGNELILHQTGVYTVVVEDELVFTGVCKSPFKIRFNQHIGNITPKCCFKDGTATHCHLNAKITEAMTSSKVFFKVCPMTSLVEMTQLKSSIIKRFEPAWNLRLA